MKCNICEEGDLASCVEGILVSYKECEDFINSYYSKCSYCGSEVVSPEQAKLNKQEVEDFKEDVDSKICKCSAYCSCECVCGAWDDTECDCWDYGGDYDED